MSNTDLISELRARAYGIDFSMTIGERVIFTRAADALEAAVKEMHARELHHFEEEQKRVIAESVAEVEQYRGDGLAADLDVAVVRAERAEADNRRLLEERANLTSDAALAAAADVLGTTIGVYAAIEAALATARGEDT